MDTTSPATSSLSVKGALDLLDKLASEHVYTCWVPSIEGSLTFKEVTAGQQKALLQSIVDSPLYKSKFIITTYEILKKNFVDENIKFDDLTIFDKQLILLKTRIECFESTYEVDSTNTNIDKNIDLNKVYEDAMEIKVEPRDKVTYENITIYVRVPDVKTEYELEKELHESIDIMNINSAQALRTTLGDIFISEISKYITMLTIEDNSIDLATLPFRKRIEILEKLPATALQQVIKFIDATKEKINQITTVKIPVKKDNSWSTESVTETFAIDGAFFTTKQV